MSRYCTITYDEKKYDFVSEMVRLFFIDTGISYLAGRTESLKNVHECMKESHKGLFKVGEDSATSLHYLFYEKYKSGWPEMEYLYDYFISGVVAALFDEDFLYQRFPTVRFHLRKNLAVGDFHTDAEFHHPAGEINYIIPLTDSDDTACPWVESEPGKRDFEAIPLRIGELIQFNGNILRHGNLVNETNHTRVSMDFRVLPASKYDESAAQSSITTNTKFTEGKYYKRFTK